mmetsp:Transcript_20511/g.40618  ORF Transcript_20511/g.40618 Transcript_20511/m.40618 type:complete len:247 (+) Transcript_20511:209-949(+)
MLLAMLPRVLGALLTASLLSLMVLEMLSKRPASWSSQLVMLMVELMSAELKAEPGESLCRDVRCLAPTMGPPATALCSSAAAAVMACSLADVRRLDKPDSFLKGTPKPVAKAPDRRATRERRALRGRASWLGTGLSAFCLSAFSLALSESLLLTGCQTLMGRLMPLTVMAGPALAKLTISRAAYWILLSTTTPHCFWVACCIKRAARFTTEPSTVYSLRPMEPTTPANALPHVTPTLARNPFFSNL